MITTKRRVGAVIAGAALGVGTLGAVPSAHAADYDTIPLDQSISWITGRLTDGALSTQYGPDYSTTGYLALALQHLGGHDAELAPIVATLEAHARDQINGYPGGTDVYAGSTAKLAVIVQAAGDDPTDVSGVDLIGTLEGQVRSNGRTSDTSDYGDYANTIGQAYAVHALTTAGSSKAAVATDFLLQQQCAGGWFRLTFSKPDAADQSCGADPTSRPDPDATSFVLLELQGVADTNPKVARAIGRAESWLAGQQRADGSFGGGASTEASNANSTGLAGWALGELGHRAVAERAATWLRTLQAHEVPACPTKMSGETGAIAYDPATLTTGRANGIEAADAYTWQLAQVQSFPLLQWLPVSSGAPAVSVPSGYQAGGSQAVVSVSGAAAAQTLCLTVGAAKTVVTAGPEGVARAVFTLPGATGDVPVTVAGAAGTLASATVKVLGAATPREILSAKKVKRGKRLGVRATGLAAGERVSLRLGKRTVKIGTANSAGVFATKVKIARKTKPGKVKVTVVGQFANRTNTKIVKVVR